MKIENAEHYLGKIAPKFTPAIMVVDYGQYDSGWYSVARDLYLPQQLASAEIEGISVQVTMNSVWGTGFYPLPPGEYRILVPDAPHNANMTGYYQRVEPSLSHHQVWFPIDFGDRSRYIHVGNISDGCATVISLAKWSQIHTALVSHRDPNNKGVIGRLVVKGRPEREK